MGSSSSCQQHPGPRRGLSRKLPLSHPRGLLQVGQDPLACVTTSGKPEEGEGIRQWAVLGCPCAGDELLSCTRPRATSAAVCKPRTWGDAYGWKNSSFCVFWTANQLEKPSELHLQGLLQLGGKVLL